MSAWVISPPGRNCARWSPASAFRRPAPKRRRSPNRVFPAASSTSGLRRRVAARKDGGNQLQRRVFGSVMTHTFHASIIREYDVRGIVGDTLSEKDARALGRSYGALAVSEGAKRIAVGRDGRTH